MPNISPINLDQPGAAADIVNVVKEKVGSVPNIFAIMARSPAVLEGYLAFKGALDSGLLRAGVREQIALAVAGETLAHVGLNLFTNYYNHVANTEIDFPFVTTVAKK